MKSTPDSDIFKNTQLTLLTWAQISRCLQVFLGQLRDSEVERINERISQAVMETCLAMTIFREEFNVGFVAMFTILTFIKVFHWLVQDRVDFIETTPQVSRLSHVRVISFMLLLLVRPLLDAIGSSAH